MGWFHNWTLWQLHHVSAVLLYYRQLIQFPVIKTNGFRERQTWHVAKMMFYPSLNCLYPLLYRTSHRSTESTHHRTPPWQCSHPSIEEHTGCAHVCGAPEEPLLEYMMTEATRLGWHRFAHAQQHFAHVLAGFHTDTSWGQLHWHVLVYGLETTATSWSQNHRITEL